MKAPNYVTNYSKQTQDMIKAYGVEQAMSMTVGGNFEAIGIYEHCLLMHHGLCKDHTIIDVGCGSGRLAVQLKDYLTGPYIGIDVVPELLEHAKQLCDRREWKFYVGPGLAIPEPERSADFVSFFSVFTHLMHEESYKYLQDAFRVVNPGGKIVFSFMDFAIPDHWNSFESYIANTNPDKVLLQFISRDAIQAWADHLHVNAVEIYDGDKPHFALDRPVRWDNGAVTTPTTVSLGQSVCVLTK
jgi:SAM-dependent methyltransferase